MPANQRGRSRSASTSAVCRGIVAALSVACGAAVGLAQDGKPVVPPARANQPRTTPQPTTPPRSNAPASQPAAQRGAEMLQAMKQQGGLRDDGTFEFSAFSEPVDLAELVEFVRDEMGLQLLYTDSGLRGQTVVINTPITLKQEQVLPFLLMLMEQKDYTIIQDESGVHMVMPKGSIQANPSATGVLAPTKVIRTTGIKPSSMQPLIQSMLGNKSSAAGGTGIQYLDELGVIVVTDTPRNTRLVEEAVQLVLAERTEVMKFQRFEIHNVAAASARDRIIELLGSTAPRSAPAAQGAQGNQQTTVAAAGGSFSNLPERLTVDPGGNALFFRGREDEARLLGDLLAIVDVPITLISRFYPVGIETAETVATEGTRQQLGEVTTFESSSSGVGASGLSRANLQRPGQANQPGVQNVSALSGSGFVIYPSAGGFIYRGTEAQHARVDALVRELGDLIDRDTTITEFYKLKHAKAEEAADLINSLLTGETRTGGSSAPLFGSDLGSRDRLGRNRRVQNPLQQQQQAANAGDANAQPLAPGEVGLGELEGANIQVVADQNNNQLLVKAPRKLQPQMRTLIDRIDLLRPQVYIDAKIVTVTLGDDFRFAAEVQTIIGQFALNTNFGLGSFGESGSLLDRKEPAANLAGLTSALIRSKDVPFIINTISRNNNARVVASPQLLVDDNQEAEVSSLDQQPTLTTSIGSNGGNDTQSFGGFEPAGPKLRVVPQISDGGSVKLEYEIELSAFSGESSIPGVPPPKREDKVRADSVTVPSDTTIVVGGLVFESKTETRTGIPLLMDIPLVGYLFSDTRQNSRKTLLYVFMTPRIMRDTSFNDLRLLSKNALAESDLKAEIPEAEPLQMKLMDQQIKRPYPPNEDYLRRPPTPGVNAWPAD